MPQQEVDPAKWAELVENFEPSFRKSSGDWMPDVGWSGAVVMTRVEKFIFTDKKSQTEMLGVKPYVREADDPDATEFPLGVFTPKNFIGLRIVASKVAGGDTIGSLAAAEAVLDEAADNGTILNVHVEESGQYTNVLIDSVADTN